MSKTKAWTQLESAAAELELDLLRTDGCVTVFVHGRIELLTITTGNPLEDDVADRVCRASLSAALEQLSAIRRREAEADEEQERLTCAE